MKREIPKFLFKFLFVLLIISSAIFYTEIKLKEIPNSYSFKRFYFEKKLDSTQVIILGTSQPMEGINPIYIKMKGFNLANNLQSLYYDKEITLKYLDRLPKLKVVLISISYFSLWFEVRNITDNWRDNFYSKFWDIKPNNSRIFDLSWFSYIALYGPSFSQNAFRKNFKVEIEVMPDESNEYGWMFKKTDFLLNPTDSLGKDRVMLHRSLMQDNALKDNISNLDTLLKEIAMRNIVPVFIASPVHKTYFDNLDPQKCKIIEEVINGLCLKYHCRYFNFAQDSRFDNDDFADVDHLNPKGAEKYTKILENEVLAELE